ncbi:MAG: hypothetical protein WBX11_15110 [Thiobacillaceae bacterium]
MQTLLPIIVRFFLTGFIGNRLVHSWQSRNWLVQQRFLGQEREYIALNELADEIASLLGTRVFVMRRLTWALKGGGVEAISLRKKEYDDILFRWNENLPSFLIRLAILADKEFEFDLERSIQEKLVKVGSGIESLLAGSNDGLDSNKVRRCIQLDGELNHIQGRIISFNEKLLNLVESRRVDIYFGKKLKFAPENLGHLSIWQLIKALFIRDVYSFPVIRSPLDL